MQFGQKWGESDWDFRQRKNSEAADESQAAVIAIFGLVVVALLCAWKIVKWLALSICSLTKWLNLKLSKYLVVNYQRYAVIATIYLAIFASSMYAVYLQNVLGFYSLRTLVTTLQKDETFALRIKKSAYKYHSHSFNSPDIITLVGVDGPGKDHFLPISLKRAAHEMVNGENKKPIDITPELASLVESTSITTPATKKTARKHKKKSKATTASDSDETIDSTTESEGTTTNN